jgi:hypothetical protein
VDILAVSACQLHALSKLEISTLEWPFDPSTRHTYIMIMLFNQLLDMSHLSGGWIILAKEKSSITGMCTFERNVHFGSMEHFWDIFFFSS